VPPFSASLPLCERMDLSTVTEKTPFTPGMKDVMRFARAEAGRLNHDHIAPLHYLLGIVRKCNGVAVEALLQLEVDLETLRKKIESMTPSGTGPPPIGTYNPTEEARRVVEASKDIAIDLKHSWIGTEHLLLALINSEGIAGEALRISGVTYENARTVILEIIRASARNRILPGENEHPSEPRQSLSAVSVIIPVYNEPKAPADLGAALRDALGADAEILVVDDGSEPPVAKKDLPEGTRLIRLPMNRGYGAAIKTGLAASEGECIVIIDADGTYPVEAVPRLIDQLADHEMAVGARTGANVQMPFMNRLVKGMLTRLASFLAEQPIPDINSGLRAFRRASAAPYLRLLPNRFSLTTTLTLAFLCDGRRVHFEPIDYHPRVGKSHWRPVRDTREFIITILRTIFFFNPMRVCLPLTLFLWLAAAGVLVASAVWAERVMDGTVAVLALGGLQILVVGLLAEVVSKRD